MIKLDQEQDMALDNMINRAISILRCRIDSLLHSGGVSAEDYSVRAVVSAALLDTTDLIMPSTKEGKALVKNLRYF